MLVSLLAQLLLELRRRRWPPVDPRYIAIALDHPAHVVVADIGSEARQRREPGRQCLGVFDTLVGRPGTGVLNVNEQRQVVEIASPMGVVFGLLPRTHPVATLVFKVLTSTTDSLTFRHLLNIKRVAYATPHAESPR